MIQCVRKRVIALLMATAASLPMGEIVDSVECVWDSAQRRKP
jgi:hypothetical protein